MLKPKYSLDLAGHMAECDANYLRLTKLLPDMSDVDVREFTVELAGSHCAHFRLEVTERCKYTTMLTMSQLSFHTLDAVNVSRDHALTEKNHSAKNSSWVASPNFSLRVYHDAQMAEVVAYDNHRPVHAKYDYPNNNMYQHDEKAQMNIFLGEWLSHCLQYGRVLNIETSKVFS